jgi:anti-sigma factor RsiW
VPSPCDLIHALADGELDPADAEELAAHVATCEPCALELERILALRGLVETATNAH